MTFLPILSFPYLTSVDLSYINANSGRSLYTFVIPISGCGTRNFDNEVDGTSGFQNMIMIQNEEFVQEIWDMARKITCDWTNRMEKLITFQPFAVDMLQAKEVRYSGDDLKCWMDIKVGKGPFGDPIDGIVKIGEELTIVVYSKDGGMDFDMLVKNCYAYNSQNIGDKTTTSIQLSDDKGCLLKPKLMNYFYRTRDTGSTGADLISYASLYAFKFPDKMDFYLTCEVELCKGGCKDVCQDPKYPTNVINYIVSTTSTTTTRSPPVDYCVISPGSPQCCNRTPKHSSCKTTTTQRPDPCLTNPGSFQCCARNPSHPRCTTTTTTRRPDPCVTNPGSFQCCARNPSHPRCTTTTTTTTTLRPDPCVTNPGSFQCCARNPSHPRCTTTTTTTTTRRPDPCVTNPGSSRCCSRDSSHPSCIKEPCSGPSDPRPQCQSTTRPPTTTPNLEHHAFHAWRKHGSKPSRRRRPPYGSKLSPAALEALKRRSQRDVAFPPPPPPPPQRTVIAMARGFRVVADDDLNFPSTSWAERVNALQEDSVCVPTVTFAIGLFLLSLLLVTAVLVAAFTCLKLRILVSQKKLSAKNFYYQQ